MMKNDINDLEIEISLRCPGCCNYYQGKNRANLLKCGHNICTECLNINSIKREKSNYTCLICLKSYSKEDLEEITINFLFDELVSKYVLLDKPSIGIFENKNLEYNLFCVQCDNILSCPIIHSKLFPSHNITSLHEMIQDKAEYFKNISEDFNENFVKNFNLNNFNKLHTQSSKFSNNGKSQILLAIEEFLDNQLKYLNTRIEEVKNMKNNSNLEALNLLGLISQSDYKNLIHFKNFLNNIESDGEEKKLNSNSKIIERFFEDKLKMWIKEKEGGSIENSEKIKKELEVICKNIIDVDLIYENKVSHILNRLKEIWNNIQENNNESQLEKFAEDLGTEMSNYLRNYFNFNNTKTNSNIIKKVDHKFFVSQDLTQLSHLKYADKKKSIYIYDSLSEKFLLLAFDGLEKLKKEKDKLMENAYLQEIYCSDLSIINTVCGDGTDTVFLLLGDNFFIIKYSENENEFTENKNNNGKGAKNSPIKCTITDITKLKSPNLLTKSNINFTDNPPASIISIYYDFKIFILGTLPSEINLSRNILIYYDLISKIWINLPELPQVLQHPRSIIVSDKLFLFDCIKSCFYLELNKNSEINSHTWESNSEWKKIKLLYDGSYNLDLRNYSIVLNRFLDSSMFKNSSEHYDFLIIGGCYFEDKKFTSYNTHVFKFNTYSGNFEMEPDERISFNYLECGMPNMSYSNSYGTKDVNGYNVLLGENNDGEVMLIKFDHNS